MTNFETNYTKLLKIYEKQAQIIKSYITNDLFENQFEDTNDEERHCEYILPTILNFRDIINFNFKGTSDEDMLKIIEAAQKHELAELYKVKTVEDLRNYREKILAEHN